MSSALEDALAAHDAEVKKLTKAGKDLLAAIHKWQRAVEVGNLVDARKFADVAKKRYEELAEPLQSTHSAWNFDGAAYLESGEWLRELQATIKAKGGDLKVFEDRGDLICPPLVVRAVPSQAALRMGKSLWKKMRPMAVMEELKRLTSKDASRQDQAFLDQLYNAAVYLTRDKSSGSRVTAKLRDIYELWSVAPGWKKDNPELAFTQALYSLHQSDVRVTRGGKKYEFEFPTGTPKRSDVFSVTATDGRPVNYYLIHFR